MNFLNGQFKNVNEILKTVYHAWLKPESHKPEDEIHQARCLVENHLGIFKLAFDSEMAICGSLGLHLGHNDPHALPGDLDFVTTDIYSAMEFISVMQLELKEYKSHTTIYVQNQTSWVPSGALVHIRIQNSMLMPICIMVLNPKNEFNVWYRSWGLRVQKYNDICKYAQDMVKRDGKTRHLPKVDDSSHSSTIDDLDMPDEEEHQNAFDWNIPIEPVNLNKLPTSIY